MDRDGTGFQPWPCLTGIFLGLRRQATMALRLRRIYQRTNAPRIAPDRPRSTSQNVQTQGRWREPPDWSLDIFAAAIAAHAPPGQRFSAGTCTQKRESVA